MSQELEASAPVTSALSIAVVDDDPDHAEVLITALRSAFRDEPFRVRFEHIQDAESALVSLPKDETTVVLLDYQLGGPTGIDWLPDFVRADFGPVVLLTSSGDQRVAAEAFRKGAFDYQTKTEMLENPELFRKCVVESSRRYHLSARNTELTNSLRRLNRNLSGKNAELHELAQTAERFVADVAHEFRTPLTVVKEFASIINDGLGGEVTEKQCEFLKYIIDAAEDLSGLVDDFLDSSKIRAKTLRVDRGPFDLRDEMERLRPLLEGRASVRGVAIEIEIAEGLPRVFADPEKLRRAVLNLVVNAIKFSPSGGVVRIGASEDSPGRVRLAVSDQGPGIDEDGLARLFNRFQQATQGKQSTVKGFGLGLSIVRDLMDVNLGTVDVESELNKGSTFSLTFPIDDPVSIVGAIVDCVRRTDPTAQISVIDVEPVEGGTDVSEAVAVLSSCCRPLDLVVPNADGTGVLLVGATEEPNGWISRVREQLASESDSTAIGEGSLAFSVRGSWPVTRMPDSFSSLFGMPRRET